MGMVTVHQAPLLTDLRIGRWALRATVRRELELFTWLNSVSLHCSLPRIYQTKVGKSSGPQ